MAAVKICSDFFHCHIMTKLVLLWITWDFQLPAKLVCYSCNNVPETCGLKQQTCIFFMVPKIWNQVFIRVKLPLKIWGRVLSLALLSFWWLLDTWSFLAGWCIIPVSAFIFTCSSPFGVSSHGFLIRIPVIRSRALSNPLWIYFN